MDSFLTFFFPALFIVLLLRLISTPIRWFWKISINSACGFLCLWLLNSLSVFTGIVFPVNILTVAVAGFLGLPGIGALTVVQFFL